MKSMTGFGNSKLKNADANVEINIRSLNGRYLDIKTHLPAEYMSYEPFIRKKIAQYFFRGSVTVFVSRKLNTVSKKSSVKINKNFVKSWKASYEKLAKELKIKGQLEISDLVKIPELVQYEMDTSVDKKEEALLKKTLDRAIQRIVSERKREGTSLKKDIGQNISSLKKNIEIMKKQALEWKEYLQKKYKTELEKHTDRDKEFQDKVQQDWMNSIDKSDVGEELSRLTEHCRAYVKLLTQKVSVGKKMDFYTQELHREVNTIGSKSQSVELTQTVVEAKTLVEKIREQVQNIE